MPNGSEDDLPCQEQRANYKACAGFKPLKTCKDCRFFRAPGRDRSKPSLPCELQPRAESDAICPHYRKADRQVKERPRVPLHALGSAPW